MGKHLKIYLYGSLEFTVITDHKKIWTKPKQILQTERWGLRLQPFKFKIVYRPGEEKTSDYLSLHLEREASHSAIRERLQLYLGDICYKGNDT